MNKNLLSIALFIMLISSLSAEPSWVRSRGTVSPYSTDNFLTGFAMINKFHSDALIRVKEIALADLTGRIETKVNSVITLSEQDGPEGYSSNASILTRNSVNVTVSGVDYLVHEDNTNTYALAYVSAEDLSASYIQKADEAFNRASALFEKAGDLISADRKVQAMELLYEARTELVKLAEQQSLYLSISPRKNIEDFQNALRNYDRDLGVNIDGKLDELDQLDLDDISSAMDKIALIMKRQSLSAGNVEVPPATFESTSFSSELGRYAALRLEAALIGGLSTSNGKTIYRSHYWLEENIVHFQVLAMDEQGNKLGQAAVRFPYSGSLRQYDIKPQNFEEAMIALKEFSEGALTDGGLNVEIWTNKGRDRDSLVFEDGEILQLYMRVNQPAFLQITYKLATGQMVLLEKSFYIGMDRVNRTVALPYEFEVLGPFGAEQMIVTAFSKEPPSPQTIIDIIDGEEYEVFSSIGAVVAQTRGLRKKQSNNEEDVRVGEAILNLTTIP
jgi:hypothetical protein